MLGYDMPEPPDLQKLVELRGGYHKITREDWALYDKQMKETHAWLVARHKVGSARPYAGRPSV